LAGLTVEDKAGRKRAAVELIAREGAALRKTALRFSLCQEDAEDAYQRALEILLVKAPTERPRELARWTQTVVKHEALAIRHSRERLLGASAREGAPDAAERVALLPAGGDGPDDQAERQQQVARSREALQALKPAELRTLALLATGCSYAEIGEITGFSRTKVNRCLAEGRERFRRIVSDSEDGSRCAELAPLVSAFCDGELGAEDSATVREHLRACAGCRAAMRSYRATPATVSALPVSRSLLERAQELLAGLHSGLPAAGGAADASVAQVAAAGGTRGAGMAALAKLLAVCAGTVGGAAACVATGVAPPSLDPAPGQERAPKVEPVSERAVEEAAAPAVEYQPAPEPPAEAEAEKAPPKASPAEAPAAAAPASGEASAGAIEYIPPPAPAPPAEAPSAASSSGSSRSAAGEFGP
jgi:RNA polymerase sigma factor (sigma-70 family)